jgi:hypothetical protein
LFGFARLTADFGNQNPRFSLPQGKSYLLAAQQSNDLFELVIAKHCQSSLVIKINRAVEK